MSNTDAIIVVLVIVALVVVAVSIGITYYASLARKKKYVEFIKRNSPRLKALRRVNNLHPFEDFDDNPLLYLHFDNKTTWNKTEPIDYLTREVRTHLDDYREIKYFIKENKELKPKYLAKVKEINCHIDEETCEEAHFNYKRCLRIEDEVFSDTIIKPKTTIKIDVELNYTSPQGRVDESKEESFSYNQLLAIMESVSQSRMEKNVYDSVVKGERALVTDSLRYDVMRRDGFRCKLCGASADDGVKLHVDHIIPVSKGGKTTMSNLRTLCERCNMGKSNKIE